VKKIAYWTAGSIAVLVILVIVLSYAVDEPLRRKMEGDLNNRLKGYSVRIGHLDFHPIGLSLDLEQAVIHQTAHPDPPVAEIPSLSASVHWKALLFGHLVADFEINDPKVHFDLRQFAQEAKDEVPMKDKGWQDAVQAIYPLKINRFAIYNGDLTYMDKGPFKPLHITKLNLVAENIRNVQSAEGTFPSPVQADGVVFDRGTIKVNGNADFLAEPHVALNLAAQLDQIALDYFKPIAERYKLAVQQGVLSADGSFQYTREGTRIEVTQLRLDNLVADYIHTTAEAPTKKVAKETGKVAREHANEPTFELKVDQVQVRNGRLGYVNQAAKPPYPVFFANTNLTIENLSNHLKEGVAHIRAEGKFMGSGPAKIEAAFRPENKGSDLNLAVSIDDTDMRSMNDLFRAYGNFDVVAGKFSFYSELKVRQGKIEGYVKPLFRDMDVYDQRQDKEKSVFRKLYEGLVGGISGLLQNKPREEVATKIPVSGDIESPQTSTWETVGNLVQNAFFKAILPGFERQIAQGKGEGGRG